MFDKAPTVTSKAETFMLQLSAEMQFRWVALDEMWGLPGMPPADVVGWDKMDMVLSRFSNIELTKFAGQAFHQLSMAILKEVLRSATFIKHIQPQVLAWNDKCNQFSIYWTVYAASNFQKFETWQCRKSPINRAHLLL